MTRRKSSHRRRGGRCAMGGRRSSWWPACDDCRWDIHGVSAGADARSSDSESCVGTSVRMKRRVSPDALPVGPVHDGSSARSGAKGASWSENGRMRSWFAVTCGPAVALAVAVAVAGDCGTRVLEQRFQGRMVGSLSPCRRAQLERRSVSASWLHVYGLVENRDCAAEWPWAALVARLSREWLCGQRACLVAGRQAPGVRHGGLRVAAGGRHPEWHRGTAHRDQVARGDASGCCVQRRVSRVVTEWAPGRLRRRGACRW